MKITQYTNNKGEKLFMWSGYVGTDAVGQVITKRRGFTSKRDAEYNYLKFVDEFNAGMHHRKPLNTADTLQALYDLWYPTYANSVKPPTLNKVKRQMEIHFLDTYGERLLTDFTPPMVQKLVIDLQAKLVEYKKALQYLSKVFDLGVSLDLMPINPLTKITYPAKRQIDKPLKVMDETQFKLFWQTVNKVFPDRPDIYAFIRLLSFTGMRRGEALALSWSDINWDASTVNIHKSLSRDVGNKQIILPSAKSDAGNRIITLDADTLRHLATHHTNQAKSGLASPKTPIWCTQKGLPISLSKPAIWFHKIRDADESISHVTPHVLRHTFITLGLTNNRLTPKQVQYMVGHSDASITMNVYNHITAQQADSAGITFANAISDLIN